MTFIRSAFKILELRLKMFFVFSIKETVTIQEVRISSFCFFPARYENARPHFWLVNAWISDVLWKMWSPPFLRPLGLQRPVSCWVKKVKKMAKLHHSSNLSPGPPSWRWHMFTIVSGQFFSGPKRKKKCNLNFGYSKWVPNEEDQKAPEKGLRPTCGQLRPDVRVFSFPYID